MTTRLSIKEINRSNPISIVSPSDFIAVPGDSILAEDVWEDPKFTLYCYDPENAAALFIESRDPAATDLAPFYYQGQIENAAGLVSMAFEEFHRTSAKMPRPLKSLIFVHSVSRCGSTLVSKALQAVPSVHSLSEPDDLTQLVRLRVSKTYDDGQVRELMESSVKWRLKSHIGHPVDHVAIKPRAEVMILADLMGLAFPQARHVFLYRNAVAWMRTIFRGFSIDRDLYDPELNRVMERNWAFQIPLIEQLRSENSPKNPIQIRVLAWCACMEAYLDLSESNVPTCAVRFEDLTTQPEEILRQLFAFGQIYDVDWGAIQAVLARDSLAGTIYDREERSKQTRELTEPLIRDVYETVAARPRIGIPDYVVPKTLTIPHLP